MLDETSTRESAIDQSNACSDALRSERKTLVFRVSMALSKGLSPIRNMRQLNEEQRRRVADY
jgi:hypothetical protein